MPDKILSATAIRLEIDAIGKQVAANNRVIRQLAKDLGISLKKSEGPQIGKPKGKDLGEIEPPGLYDNDDEEEEQQPEKTEDLETQKTESVSDSKDKNKTGSGGGGGGEPQEETGGTEQGEEKSKEEERGGEGEGEEGEGEEGESGDNKKGKGKGPNGKKEGEKGEGKGKGKGEGEEGEEGEGKRKRKGKEKGEGEEEEGEGEENADLDDFLNEEEETREEVEQLEEQEKTKVANLNKINELLEDIDRGADDDLKDNNALDSAIWIKPPIYWKALKEKFISAMREWMGRLAPGVMIKQRSGHLDISRAEQLKRGRLDIWKKNKPDQTMDAGVHLILSLDGTGSMTDPLEFSNEIEMNVETRKLRKEQLLPTEPALPFLGDLQRSTDSIVYSGNSKVMVVSGLAYALGNAIREIGGEVDMIWWSQLEALTVPKIEPNYSEMMALAILSGGTGTAYVPQQAVKLFKDDPTPGKVFITITDGMFDYNKEKYAAAVDELNKMGVMTIGILLMNNNEYKTADQRVSTSLALSSDKDLFLHHTIKVPVFTFEELLSVIPNAVMNVQEQVILSAERNLRI